MAATFSYAQAAKGMSSTQPSVKPTSAEPNKGVSSPEEQNNDTTAQANQNNPETDAPREAEKTVAPTAKEAEPVAAATAKQNASGTSSPSVANSSTTAPKDEDSSNTVNGTSDSTWDKQSQASGQEKTNGASTEEAKEKSAEKEKNVPPPKELKAAPLPSVNIWQQRKEAQDARSKTADPVKPAAPAAKSGAAKAASAACSTSGDNQQDPSKATSKKKGTDAVAEGAKPRSKADGGKGRDDDASIPPVGDASLWPTPQVAQGEEKKKAQEKVEKADKTEKSATSRPHGKEKWMPVPYVPTAVFNTPLPTPAARRGGRTARGGRDAGRHAPHGAGAAAADKATSGQAGQGVFPKQAVSADRGRNEPNTARANSLPAQSRRSTSAEAPAGAADLRKGVDRSRGPKGADDANAGKQVNGTEPYLRHSKGFTRNQESSAAHKGDKNPHLSVDSQAGPRNGSTQDRRFENGPKSADFANFYEHRDHHHNHHRERGDSRPERGRGGSHRGRGGHSGHGGSQNPYYTNPHMQHSFVHPKSFGYKQSMANARGVPLRSPSLPNSGAMYGVYPFPTDINTMYAAYQPVPAGPMTAFPYQPYMEPFSLMSMISMQLEYYFSVDNLCKDLFLRKHMDSQGFVPLSFIAGFKRIKSLTEDFEVLRHVGRQLRNVEHQAGEDGVDRLRPREKWEQWVFPMDQRDPSAQNEGPPPPRNESSPAHNHVDGAAVNGVSHHQSLPNGTSEPRVSKTPLSSTAPEFSPSKPLTPQNEVMNVGAPMNISPLSDDQARNLVIVTRRLGTSCHPPPKPQFLEQSPQSLCRTSVDAFQTASGLGPPETVPLPPSPITSATFSPSRDMNHANENHVPFCLLQPTDKVPYNWMKGENPLSEFCSNIVHESYHDFRKRALEKRYLTATRDGAHDMNVLYQFWSHFLVHHFNAQMYNEFRSLALDDISARRPSTGFNRLIHFYGVSLSSDKVLSDDVVRDLVDLGREESTSQGDRLVFRTLRSAWQSGFLTQRSRKKIDCVLDASLKAELEK